MARKRGRIGSSVVNVCALLAMTACTRAPTPTTSTTTTTTTTTSTTTTSTTTTTTLDPSSPAAWPGDAAVEIADAEGMLGRNISGLVYEGSGSAAPGTLWAVRNGPGRLFRLQSRGGTWTPVTTDGWEAGKALRYPGGSGDPDAEGVTVAGSPSEGIFVAAERDNTGGGSRNSILRFDPADGGTTLAATGEWDLTGELPSTDSNEGLEAITWVPDPSLVASGFVDEETGAPYDPAAYPNHGTGLFFVGLEDGGVHAFALDLTGSGFTRVATISTGSDGVMDLHFDRDRHRLWAVCDDNCDGRSAVFAIGGSGTFVRIATFERPDGMDDLNNEGFAFAPTAECVAGLRPVLWSDDDGTDDHALRRGTISCTSP